VFSFSFFYSEKNWKPEASKTTVFLLKKKEKKEEEEGKATMLMGYSGLSSSNDAFFNLKQRTYHTWCGAVLR